MHESRPEQQQNKTFRNNGTVGRILGYTYSSTTAVSLFLYCFTISWWVGGSLRTCSFLFLVSVLLLLLRAAAAAHNISTEAERVTGYYYCCFASILLLLLLLRRVMHSYLLVEVLMLLIIFLVGCAAAAAAGACAAYNISTEAESCLLYTSPSPRDGLLSRMPSSA